MTAPEDVALAFCRECLGWKKAEAHPVPYAEVLEDPKKYRSSDFKYTDLNCVTKAVRAWVQGKVEAAWLDIQLAGSTDWTKWRVSLYDVEVVHDDLCHALLSACVEACQKKRQSD